MKLRNRLIIVAACFVAAVAWITARADYHLERITPTLNQPTFVTQAPGDPTNILYYTTRIHGSSSGFNPSNPMGGVWRYDVNTRISTEVLNLSSRTIINDEGLQAIAFHPDFNDTNASGYGKLYVSASQHFSGPSVNRVDEFTLLNLDGTFKTTNQVALTVRPILRYTNSTQNNHTVDWIGFDPNATGPARNYLYISTGDGSYGFSYNGGSGTTGRPSQNTNDVKGKILRVDISGPDDYASTNKNFAIPPSNPFPAYNAAHPSTPINGLGELYVTGVRNGYRVSFDRATSDMYWGDVGENAWEEVNFLKAGANDPGPPVDYGWPQLEATHNSGIIGAPQTTTNPFTGVISFYPIREYAHGVGFAAIGGYVYRGPIPEFQGKYFYAEFVLGRIWMLDFNRDTDPAIFKGTNGLLTEVTSAWNARIIDPSNPAYLPDNTLTTSNGLDHVVSFGEDNAGNLYLVDLGYGTSFDGQYTANAGEIFKVVPGPVPAPPLNWTNLGSSLKFTWNGYFKLQSQTNVLGMGLRTNWGDYPGGGTNQVTVPIDATKETLFFRLILKP